MSSEKEKVGEVKVGGKMVPVYYEGKSGEMVVPSNVEKEIVLDFIGRSLATLVTAITIVAWGAYRDFRVTYEKISGLFENEINAVKKAISIQNDSIHVAGEIERMRNTLHLCGEALAKLSNSEYREFHYPEDVKRLYADDLKRIMKENFEKGKG